MVPVCWTGIHRTCPAHTCKLHNPRDVIRRVQVQCEVHPQLMTVPCTWQPIMKTLCWLSWCVGLRVPCTRQINKWGVVLIRNNAYARLPVADSCGNCRLRQMLQRQANKRQLDPRHQGLFPAWTSPSCTGSTYQVLIRSAAGFSFSVSRTKGSTRIAGSSTACQQPALGRLHMTCNMCIL